MGRPNLRVRVARLVYVSQLKYMYRNEIVGGKAVEMNSNRYLPPPVRSGPFLWPCSSNSKTTSNRLELSFAGATFMSFQPFIHHPPHGNGLSRRKKLYKTEL